MFCGRALVDSIEARNPAPQSLVLARNDASPTVVSTGGCRSSAEASLEGALDSTHDHK